MITFRAVKTALFSWIVLFFAVLFMGLTGCQTSPETESSYRNSYGENIPYSPAPARACVTSGQDTVRYAATSPLIVAPLENRRNRCFVEPLSKEVYCYNSTRDSVFVVKNSCSMLLSFSPSLSECVKFHCEIGRG